MEKMYDAIVVGGGPAGLSAAIYMARARFRVLVIEKEKVGGQITITSEVVNYPGIIMTDGEQLTGKMRQQAENFGAEFLSAEVTGLDLDGDYKTVHTDRGDFKAPGIIYAAGAHPRLAGFEGESEFRGHGVAYCATCDGAFFRGRTVAVVGGGNVAMDAARSALRLGAESVYIVYRRGMAELPARKEEVEHAEEEGIIFKTLCNPVAIHPDEDGFVHSMTCIEMELGEPDASGRRRPIEKPGSEFELEVDTVIMSLGTSPNPLIRSTTPGLETNKHGCIVTEGDEGKTSRDGVYAGGDAVTGAATVIKAMGAGKAAAKAMDEYIRNK